MAGAPGVSERGLVLGVGPEGRRHRGRRGRDETPSPDLETGELRLSIFGYATNCGEEKGKMARIDQVAGIGGRQATRLRKAGVRTSNALTECAATRRGRTQLAKETGLSPKDLQLWVHHADLLRVKGVGAEYAALLVVAGVDTLRDLRRRNPTALLAKIIAMNGSQKVVERLPTEGMVEGWISAAGELDPSISM